MKSKIVSKLLDLSQSGKNKKLFGNRFNPYKTERIIQKEKRTNKKKKMLQILMK